MAKNNIGRPKKWIPVPSEQMGKWEILRKSTHAQELADLTGYTKQTIYHIFRTGDAPDQKVINKIDRFYQTIINELEQVTDFAD